MHNAQLHIFMFYSNFEIKLALTATFWTLLC